MQLLRLILMEWLCRHQQQCRQRPTKQRHPLLLLLMARQLQQQCRQQLLLQHIQLSALLVRKNMHPQVEIQMQYHHQQQQVCVSAARGHLWRRQQCMVQLQQ
jgi:hypothetical protein